MAALFLAGEGEWMQGRRQGRDWTGSMDGSNASHAVLRGRGVAAAFSAYAWIHDAYLHSTVELPGYFFTSHQRALITLDE